MRVYYVLNLAGEPTCAESVLEWVKALERATIDSQAFATRAPYEDLFPTGTQVGFTIFLHIGFVSTVFLGIPGAAMWESMFFADNDNHPLDTKRERCNGTREQAMSMHVALVTEVAQHYNIPIPSSLTNTLERQFASV
jgi:hypothetical protein